MAYHSKYSGAEVDALLDKIKNDNVGSIDSSLSTTSENPVKNKVITEELNKKANKTDIATINGQPLTNGGNIEVITDAYDDTEIKGKLTELAGKVNEKQDALNAGQGISINHDTKTISCTLDTTIFKVVDSLPTAPASGDENKIHLVLSSSSEEGNTYDEYLWTNDSWEKIGSLTDAPKDGKVYGRSDGEWVGVDSNWEFIRSESFADYGGGDHKIFLAEVTKYKEVKWIISKDTADNSLSGWIRPSIGYFIGEVFRNFILGWTNIYTSGLKSVQYSGWISYDNTIDYEFARYDNTSAQASAYGANIEMKQCYIPTEQEKEVINNPASAYTIPLVAGSYNGTETIYIYGKRR